MKIKVLISCGVENLKFEFDEGFFSEIKDGFYIVGDNDVKHILSLENVSNIVETKEEKKKKSYKIAAKINIDTSELDEAIEKFKELANQEFGMFKTHEDFFKTKRTNHCKDTDCVKAFKYGIGKTIKY